MYAYLNALGWKKGSYQVAIGIRADEQNRTAPGLFYPFVDVWPTTKPDVNTFWRGQPFRLELTGYDGNCKTCWKKSTRKLLTILDENPQRFEFFERMQEQYGQIGPEFAKGVPEGYRRVFFRKNLKVQDLRNIAAVTQWDRAENDAVIYNKTSVPLDGNEGCVESCEIEF